MKKEVNSPEETYEFARSLAENAHAGETYALTGDLGAGKTVFAKGFAAGLGISEMVTSPTFTIMQIYGNGRLPLYHFDVYRIDDPDEMYAVGFDDYVGGDGVALIEWADRIRELLPEDTVRIRIRKCPKKGENARIIELV